MENIDEYIDYFKKNLKIDRNNLDEEVIRQPGLYEEVSTQAALAISKRDELEEKLKITAAQLDTKVRKRMEKRNERITEPIVKNKILGHMEYKDVWEDYIELRRKAARLQALKESYQQRGYMLRELVTLYVNSYYSLESAQSNQHKAKKARAQHGEREMAAKRKASKRRSSD